MGTDEISEQSLLWSQLRESLSRMLNQSVELHFPTEWCDKHLRWYEELESISFRSQLRYTISEIEDRLRSTDPFVMFVLADGQPEAVILGYALDNVPRRTFYLDTIAVRRRGMGIGTQLLKTLIKWLQIVGYERIELDTEETDEKGIPLRSFYMRLGFEVLSVDAKGDVRMGRDLPDSAH